MFNNVFLACFLSKHTITLFYLAVGLFSLTKDVSYFVVGFFFLSFFCLSGKFCMGYSLSAGLRPVDINIYCLSGKAKIL